MLGNKFHWYLQYIPRNMHAVFALLCFVVVIHWLIFTYPSGLLHWHCGNLTIAPVPAKQPWWIWINTSCEFIMNDCITTTKQSTTKPCAYFLGYTVWWVNLMSTRVNRNYMKDLPWPSDRGLLSAITFVQYRSEVLFPGVGVTKPISSVPLFSEFSSNVKTNVSYRYHVYIWQVSPQLSCVDTCQLWMWFEEAKMYFCHIENFAYGEINERTPTPGVLISPIAPNGGHN